MVGGGGTGPAGAGPAGADRGSPADPLSKRVRAKSAALWGTVGGFAFLVLAQGYLLVDGAVDLPVGYAGLFAIACGIAVASGGLAYATEHRLRAKRRT